MSIVEIPDSPIYETCLKLSQCMAISPSEQTALFEYLSGRKALTKDESRRMLSDLRQVFDLYITAYGLASTKFDITAALRALISGPYEEKAYNLLAAELIDKERTKRNYVRILDLLPLDCLGEPNLLKLEAEYLGLITRIASLHSAHMSKSELRKWTNYETEKLALLTEFVRTKR